MMMEEEGRLRCVDFALLSESLNSFEKLLHDHPNANKLLQENGQRMDGFSNDRSALEIVVSWKETFITNQKNRDHPEKKQNGGVCGFVDKHTDHHHHHQKKDASSKGQPITQMDHEAKHQNARGNSFRRFAKTNAQKMDVLDGTNATTNSNGEFIDNHHKTHTVQDLTQPLEGKTTLPKEKTTSATFIHRVDGHEVPSESDANNASKQLLPRLDCVDLSTPMGKISNTSKKRRRSNTTIQLDQLLSKNKSACESPQRLHETDEENRENDTQIKRGLEYQNYVNVTPHPPPKRQESETGTTSTQLDISTQSQLPSTYEFDKIMDQKEGSNSFYSHEKLPYMTSGNLDKTGSDQFIISDESQLPSSYEFDHLVLDHKGNIVEENSCGSHETFTTSNEKTALFTRKDPEPDIVLDSQGLPATYNNLDINMRSDSTQESLATPGFVHPVTPDTRPFLSKTQRGVSETHDELSDEAKLLLKTLHHTAMDNRKPVVLGDNLNDVGLLKELLCAGLIEVKEPSSSSILMKGGCDSSITHFITESLSRSSKGEKHASLNHDPCITEVTFGYLRALTLGIPIVSIGKCGLVWGDADLFDEISQEQGTPRYLDWLKLTDWFSCGLVYGPCRTAVQHAEMVKSDQRCKLLSGVIVDIDLFKCSKSSSLEFLEVRELILRCGASLGGNDNVSGGEKYLSSVKIQKITLVPAGCIGETRGRNHHDGTLVHERWLIDSIRAWYHAPVEYYAIC